MITTVANVKTILGIKDTSKDLLIASLIPMIESQYLDIRNKAFDVDDAGNVVYPTGAELTAINMINYQINNGVGTASETIGDYSVSYDRDIINGYPRSVIGSIKRYVKYV